MTWDGVALDGSPAVKGKYTAQVKAWDNMGNDIGTRTEATGVVQSVNFDEGEPVLNVGGQKVYLRDVQSFHTADASTHSMNANGNMAAQALNTDLSGHAAPMIQSKNTTSPAQAANAYTGNTGIYD